ncbi:MAG: M3 family oligoendopeptidase, partial [Flavobacteriales bacterium]|nr:M3 family oligoendopeptidase [Flavobacteriales bacterium]
MVAVLQREKRIFLPEEFVIDSWEALKPFFEELKSRELNSVLELEKWILERSEMDSVLEEDMAWRYIKMNIDTRDEALSKSYHFFVSEISPKIAPYSNDFNKKLVDCAYLSELDSDKYFIYIRGVKSAIALFREENIPIQTELQTMSQKYGVISAKMMVEVDGESITMQKAATYFKDTDRAKREEVFRLMNVRRAKDSDELNTLYSELIEKRNQVAENADFTNFRDYMFSDMGRFDYTKEDCFNFHDSIKNELVPITAQFSNERKKKLKLDTLRPWDGDVDVSGQPPLKPFEGSRELIDKSVACLSNVNPFFGECIRIMDKMGHLDLDSKEGKAPGGFNYPLYEVGVPFI